MTMLPKFTNCIYCELWRQEMVTALQQQIREIEIQNDEIGHRAMKHKFYALLLDVLKSLKGGIGTE